jgi:hypothetical protein
MRVFEYICKMKVPPVQQKHLKRSKTRKNVPQQRNKSVNDSLKCSEMMNLHLKDRLLEVEQKWDRYERYLEEVKKHLNDGLEKKRVGGGINLASV